MNKRNIERKRIEQISPTISTGDQIQGNELFMVSARDTNSANGYSTKRMGIQALKDYVLGGNTGNNEIVISKFGGCGIVLYDVNNENYTWWSQEPLENKTFTKDCRLAITHGGDVYNTTMTLDDVLINIHHFPGLSGKYCIVDIKAGQKVSASQPETEWAKPQWKWHAIPLKQGGVFIDTAKMKSGQSSYATISGNTITALDYIMVLVNINNNDTQDNPKIKLNNKGILLKENLNKNVDKYGKYAFVYLQPGDVLEGSFLNVLPIFTDSSSSESEPESVQLWENGPYWATRNMGAKRDIDFGEYFQYGSLNGYRYENKVYVGNGSDNYEFPTNDSLVYGKSREQLLQDGIITEDNVLTPNYDAATQKYGSEWKIPSYNDWIALNSHCDMQWTRKNGVEGVMITGRNAYADKSIFLPNAGEAGSNGPTDQIRYSSTKVSYGPQSAQAAICETAYFTNSGQSAQVYVDYIQAVQDAQPIRPIKVVS